MNCSNCGYIWHEYEIRENYTTHVHRIKYILRCPKCNYHDPANFFFAVMDENPAPIPAAPAPPDDSDSIQHILEHYGWECFVLVCPVSRKIEGNKGHIYAYSNSTIASHFAERPGLFPRGETPLVKRAFILESPHKSLDPSKPPAIIPPPWNIK